MPPNSQDSFIAACSHGYGIETDLRDHSGRLVISHDPADTSAQDAEHVFTALAKFNPHSCFALNIKADGLISMLAPCLKKFGITNYFAFDMSIPQMKLYRDSGITYFTGQSDIQPFPVLYDGAAGIWADCFCSDAWITPEIVRSHTSTGRKVCFVSPELHGRDYRQFWDRIRTFDDGGSLMLCTDYPDEAAEFFRRCQHD